MTISIEIENNFSRNKTFRGNIFSQVIDFESNSQLIPVSGRSARAHLSSGPLGRRHAGISL
jgi:hypothetical protein